MHTRVRRLPGGWHARRRLFANRFLFGTRFVRLKSQVGPTARPSVVCRSYRTRARRERVCGVAESPKSRVEKFAVLETRVSFPLVLRRALNKYFRIIFSLSKNADKTYRKCNFFPPPPAPPLASRSSLLVQLTDAETTITRDDDDDLRTDTVTTKITRSVRFERVRRKLTENRVFFRPVKRRRYTRYRTPRRLEHFRFIYSNPFTGLKTTVERRNRSTIRISFSKRTPSDNKRRERTVPNLYRLIRVDLERRRMRVFRPYGSLKNRQRHIERQ